MIGPVSTRPGIPMYHQPQPQLVQRAQSVCGRIIPVQTMQHAGGFFQFFLRKQEVCFHLSISNFQCLVRPDGQIVKNVIHPISGHIIPEAFEVDMSQDYCPIGVSTNCPVPFQETELIPKLIQPVMMNTTVMNTTVVNLPPTRSSVRNHPENKFPIQTNCSACKNVLGHKCGRYSMDCHCETRPCEHKLVCNACGVFFSDETVKRRERPKRALATKHNHLEGTKAHCIACTCKRYNDCLKAGMLSDLVGRRKPRRKNDKKLKVPSRQVVKVKHYRVNGAAVIKRAYVKQERGQLNKRPANCPGLDILFEIAERN